MSPDDRWFDEPDDPQDDEQEAGRSGFEGGRPRGVRCPKCGMKVYDDVVQCPRCDSYLMTKTRAFLPGWQIWWIAIAFLVGVGAVILALMGFHQW